MIENKEIGNLPKSNSRFIIKHYKVIMLILLCIEIVLACLIIINIIDKLEFERLYYRTNCHYNNTDISYIDDTGHIVYIHKETIYSNTTLECYINKNNDNRIITIETNISKIYTLILNILFISFLGIFIMIFFYNYFTHEKVVPSLNTTPSLNNGPRIISILPKINEVVPMHNKTLSKISEKSSKSNLRHTI